MPLQDSWATPYDFATLFQYIWHRDFPIGPQATGARRVDWTIHIGVVVRTIADLMGLVTRFEKGGRKDAMLRSLDGDEIAIEWEWEGVGGDELGKLKSHVTWSSPAAKAETPGRLLKYGVLISYARKHNIALRSSEVSQKWEGAKWPLLLILVEIEKWGIKKFASGREFGNIHMVVFDKDGVELSRRQAPAYPWNVERSRWAVQSVRETTLKVANGLLIPCPHCAEAEDYREAALAGTNVILIRGSSSLPPVILRGSDMSSMFLLSQTSIWVTSQHL